MADPAEQARVFFGERAEAYRTSASHGRSEDLARMLEWLDPPADGLALDVATGGGHTALALAGRMMRVLATDVAPQMLAAVERSAVERGLRNVERALALAQAFPFAEATFSVVASRIAPHHFPDLPAFVAEAARVLRPGGALYVFDLTTPEDRAAAGVIDRVERLRDPSHGASYPPSAWRTAVEDAGLRVERLRVTASDFPIEPWIERAGMTRGAEDELRALLREHPPERLGGYGVQPDGAMRVLRVELLARKP